LHICCLLLHQHLPGVCHSFRITASLCLHLPNLHVGLVLIAPSLEFTLSHSFAASSCVKQQLLSRGLELTIASSERVHQQIIRDGARGLVLELLLRHARQILIEARNIRGDLLLELGEVVLKELEFVGSRLFVE
jgi:hypothetical protein